MRPVCIASGVLAAVVASTALPSDGRGAEPADLPASQYSGLAVGNGKQVARIGEWWVVIRPNRDGRGGSLSIAARNAPLALNAWKTIPLFAPEEGVFACPGPSRVPPSIVADAAGRLHALWGSGDELWYARTDLDQSAPSDRLKQRTAWSGADGGEAAAILKNATPGDIVAAGSGAPLVAAVRRDGSGQTVLCLGRYARGKWNFEDLAEGVGFHPPVMHVSADGTVHLAWSDTRGRLLYLRPRSGRQHDVQVLSKGGFYPNARNPAIVEVGGKVVVAYESLYTQIEYAVLDGGQWTANIRLTALDPRFASDVIHSPQLAIDSSGVAWLFLSDGTRRFTYYARWLGTRWSDVYDCRGIYYHAPRYESNLLAADWLGVEKYPPAAADDIGIALANDLAPERSEFHRVATRMLRPKAGSGVLFLDMLETAAVEHVELVLDEARKDPHNPLLKPGPPGAFDQDRVLNHGTVIFDEDKFRMWYGACHRRRGVYWWQWMSTGYAESADGVHWTKPCTHVSPASPSGPDCNRLPLPWPCALYKDPHERDPQRVYKVVQFDRHQLQLMAALEGKYDLQSSECPGGLYESGDGIHWTAEPIRVRFPGGKPMELVVQSFFIDRDEPDPERRWKAYGYAAPIARRRAGCFAYSADGRNWTSYPRNPILDPTTSEVPLVPSGPLAQIHDTVVFPYRGLYLALFHAQHDATFLDVELAVSRDGEHFVHVKPGQKVIRLGLKGDWDWQQILQTSPLAVQDKLWIFYSGQAPSAEDLANGTLSTERLVGGAGLATLRLDGFTHVRLEANQRAGTLTTIPLERADASRLSLRVNAACGSTGSILIEVIDSTTGRPIEGFTVDDCEPIRGDGLKHRVPWGDRLWLPLEGRRRCALRFHLRSPDDSPKLYSYEFEAADSGTAAR